MKTLESIEVLYDDRPGCEGWYVRATIVIDGDTYERDIPLDIHDRDTGAEELVEAARSAVYMDLCDVPEDFPICLLGFVV